MTSFPTLSRREMLRIGGLSVTGASLAPIAGPLRAQSVAKAEPRATADCVIFLNLVGSPSQMDTFDFKDSKSTPADLDVRQSSIGVKWPFGLLPQMGGALQDAVLVRSMATWETLHNLAQYYLQVGHQFSPARSQEIPCMGSVIAYETLARTRQSDFLPAFVSMNFPTGSVNGGLLREGFLDSQHAPLAVGTQKKGGMPFMLPRDYVSRFDRRMELLKSLDTARGAGNSPRRFQEWEAFTKGATRMMKSPEVAKVFSVPDLDSKRYGGTSLGDACILARNIVEADAGTRFILVNQGGWDHHVAIYGKTNISKMEAPGDRGGIYQRCAELDAAYAQLISDLKRLKTQDGRSSLLDRTLVLCMGEFGRTPGDLNDAKGRDHWPKVRSGLFAGGGIRNPGRVLGATDDRAGEITSFDWHRKRPIYPEDVTATIYSVLGIDWNKKLSNTPSGREFQYVEQMSGTTWIGSTEIKELFL